MFVGPLALPLVWKNPQYKQNVKIAITVIVIIVTVFLTYLLFALYNQVKSQFDALGI